MVDGQIDRLNERVLARDEKYRRRSPLRKEIERAKCPDVTPALALYAFGAELRIREIERALSFKR